VFILDSEGMVYKSHDKGKSYVNMHEEFKSKATLMQESSEEEIGAVKRLIIHPLDKRVIIFTGTHGFNW